MVDQPIAKPLPTHRTTQTQNKYKQIFKLRVGFEPLSGPRQFVPYTARSLLSTCYVFIEFSRNSFHHSV
jgi:hypothetical protein